MGTARGESSLPLFRFRHAPMHRVHRAFAVEGKTKAEHAENMTLEAES